MQSDRIYSEHDISFVIMEKDLCLCVCMNVWVCVGWFVSF